MRKIIVYCLIMVFMPVFASAHVYILECNPDQDAVLDAPPEKITITFVGSVEPFFSKIEVFDSEDEKVSVKKTAFSEDDTVMEVALIKELDLGEYTVKWTAMSLDGHKVTGDYTFIIH